MDVLKGYRTVVVAAVALIAGILSLSGVADIGLDHQAAIVATVMGVLQIILRKMTTTPLGAK
jgi:hypothetical protein